MVMQDDDNALGQVAYEAYSANTGGKSLATGDNLPAWGDLGEAYKTAWIAAAREVVANATEPVEEPADEAEPEVTA
jgi:hypothetical protein